MCIQYTKAAKVFLSDPHSLTHSLSLSLSLGMTRLESSRKDAQRQLPLKAGDQGQTVTFLLTP